VKTPSPRILLIGLGRLGSHILDLLVRMPENPVVLVGGRDLDYLHQRANLSLLSALQLGYTPEASSTFIDLWNIEQTAEVITHFRPDLIVCAATLVRWEKTDMLPASLARRLASAPMGPRLPFHLTLVYKLMQAIHATGNAIKVINTIYPDVVNPILGKVGLAPTSGIGDLANNVPALRKAIATQLQVPLEQVDVRVVMARYVSYWLSRRSIANTPFHFTTLVGSEDVTASVNVEAIFSQLPTTWKRIGGATGRMMAAASAAIVCEGIVRKTGIITHAPGPNGLPGGYPVKVGEEVELILPQNLSFEAAIQINEAGLRLDGIEHIASDGTVLFTEEAIAAYKEILGYECARLPLTEVEQWAKELKEKYHRRALRA
jgi:hypothetical protein